MYYSRIHAQTYANLLFFEQKRARMLGFLCVTPDICVNYARLRVLWNNAWGLFFGVHIDSDIAVAVEA